MASARIKLRDRTPENDIKYGGFLSYRHLRIIAWACLIIAQFAVVLHLEAELEPSSAKIVDTWCTIINIIGSLAVPLFLLANLSTVLQKRGDYKSLFIRFGGLATVLYLFANFVVFHYGYRTMAAFKPESTWADAARFFGQILPLFGKTGYLLNIFIDMLLVVFMFFFANYEPRVKALQGKRIIIFRLLILLPIAYEVAAVIIKYHIGMGNLSIPSPVFFLLPSKPPLIFAAFMVIVLGLRISELLYLKRGNHTKEMFEEHIKTKAHSLKISIGISAAFAAFAIIDFVLYLVLIFTTFYQYNAAYAGTLTQDEIDLLCLVRIDVFENIGIGGSMGLILVIPLVLLFSYTKTHKNPKVDLIIPVIGVALIIVVILEGSFQVIIGNLPNFLQKMRDLINQFFSIEEGQTQEQPNALLSLIHQIHL